MPCGNTEKTLESVGAFGWYQLRLFCMLGYVSVFVTTVLMVMTFSTAEPPWRCAANSTNCNLNGTYKVGDELYDYRCKIQRNDWEFAVVGDFDSIVTEWDLVCKNAVYVSIVNSTTFLLYLIGATLASLISDKFGRKTVAYPFAMCSFICGFISAFAKSYWVFALFRGLAGIGIGGFTICSFVLVIEYTGERYRSKVGYAIWYAWILGLILVAFLGYLIPNWRTLSIVTSVPGLVAVIFWWFSPESLRWLLVNGQIDEAIKILKEVARVNNKPPPDDGSFFFDKCAIHEKQKLGDIKDLFKSRVIAVRTLVSWFCWGVSGLVYYGISLSTPTVGGNMYLNFFISAVCEGVGMAIGMYLLDRFGRKRVIVYNVWLAALAMLVGGLLNFYDDGSKGYVAGKVTSSMVLGKIFIIIVFDGMYIYTSEMFPTVVRNTAMGTSSSAARVGSAMAPYIVYSERVHPLMPYSFMAAAAVVCGILCLLLPETSKTYMPDTVQQVQNNSQNGTKLVTLKENDDIAAVEHTKI